MANKLTKERLDELIMEALNKEPLHVGIKIQSNNLQAPPKEEQSYIDLIDLLQKALKAAGIEKKELKFLAGMADNNTLTEDSSELDITDIEKLFKIGTHDPSHLDKEVAGKSDPFDIAKKVDVALDTYIDKAIELGAPRDKINALLTVKREFPKMIARDLSYNPEDDTGIKTFEIPRSGQLDVASSGAKKAKIDPKLVQTFSNFFANTSDLKSRVEKLTEFSEKFTSGVDISLEEFANGAPILKIMSNITRQFNATSGGTEMEATLALIASGEKIGGSNGAGDFVGLGGKQYSAKWVQASSAIEQASFKKAVQLRPTDEHKIIYIIGVKQGDTATVSKVSKNMLQTTSVGVYLIEFTYTPEKGLRTITTPSSMDKKALKKGYANQLQSRHKNKKVATITAKWDGGDSSMDVIAENEKYGDLYIPYPQIGRSWIGDTLGTKSKAKDIIAKIGKPVGVIKFVDGDTKTFSDQYGQYVQNTKDDAIKLMSNINKKLNIISDSTLDFATDKTLNSAYSMSDNYSTMKDDMKSLFDKVLPTQGVASKVGLSEKNQTKSKKDLDKLIERVILNKMNK